jgi:hypothetical protein
MRQQSCDKEQVVAAAFHRGALTAELLAHAGGCPVCSDVLLVAQFLQEDSVHLEHELRTADASAIWARAQTMAREKALARAILPIRIARTCAYALAVLAAPWIAFEISLLPPWLPNLGLKHLFAVDGTALAGLTETTLAGITVMFICIALSSWYMLRTE